MVQPAILELMVNVVKMVRMVQPAILVPREKQVIRVKMDRMVQPVILVPREKQVKQELRVTQVFRAQPVPQAEMG